MISSALFAYAEPVKLTYAIGNGFLSGNIGSSYEQFTLSADEVQELYKLLLNTEIW